jgi:hypothetical protein
VDIHTVIHRRAAFGPFFLGKIGFLDIHCGKVAEYPQDEMCKTKVLVGKPFFVQFTCWLDTTFVQRVYGAVNY